MANKSRVGELRPSQILYSFGIGAVVDLPNMSVIVMGLDDWDAQQCSLLIEERLLAEVRKELGPQVLQLRQAPIAPESEGRFDPSDENHKIGIPVAAFPGWVLCPHCRLLAPIRPGAFDLKRDLYRPEQTRYQHTLCPRHKPPTVIPARFLVACANGHLDDFPWSYFVHKGATDCPSRLKLQEFGVSGTAADVLIKCEVCDTSRSMSQAFGELGKKSMPRCRGRHPHLHKFDDDCPEQMQTILLGASNSWFPVSLSALSIPKTTNKLTQLVEKNWAALQTAPSFPFFQAVYQAMRNMGQLAELYKYPEAEIWTQIERKRNAIPDEEDNSPDLKTPEWQAFSGVDKANNTADFQLKQVESPPAYQQYLAKVVLVEKLREVRALIGFTRIESPYDYENPEELPEKAPLSRHDPKWIPACEVRGEGIFIQFSEDALRQWEQQDHLYEYDRKNLEAHQRWRQSRGLDPNVGYRGLRYILLHSFSHALMRQLAIECGYTAASIRERIYSKRPEEDDGPMAGILIYTAAPDSEGTLGGLVSLGQPEILGRHIEQALEQMRLCASDPLCAEHDPLEGSASLHWAACHACLFSPETSCERGNKYLDRGLLTASVKVADMAFFR